MSAPAIAAGPRSVSANRRQRARLRDLCDEVLASFRVAHERDLFSDGDRHDTRQMLAAIRPGGAR